MTHPPARSTQERPAAASTWSPSHVPSLDGVRGLAILLVLFVHFFYPFGAHTRIDQWVLGVGRIGWSGVDLFFVLSGFLITGILLDTRGRSHFLRSFYARRVLRIFPLYYAVLALYFLIFPLVPIDRFPAYVAETVGDQFWFWTYLTNFRLMYLGEWYANVVPNVFWSLSIEEHFYMVWPAVVLFCDRKPLLRITLALIIGSLLLRTGMTLAGLPPIATTVFTLARLDTLAVGALLAILARGTGGLSRFRRPAWWLLGGTFVLLAFFHVVQGGLTPAGDLTRTLGFTLVALFYGSLILLVLTAPQPTAATRFFSSRFMRMLGKYSYALYIFHGPVGTFLEDILRPQEFPTLLGSSIPGLVVFVSASMAVSLLVSILSWNLLEKHFLKLKRYFTPGKAAGKEAL